MRIHNQSRTKKKFYSGAGDRESVFSFLCDFRNPAPFGLRFPDSKSSMPVDLEIIRASEFLRMGSKGEIDAIAIREVLARVARACRLRGIHRAFLDRTRGRK